MKFPFYKGLVVFILLSVFSCQPKPEEVSLDLSAKKIKPALAEKMSKKFVNETSKLLMLSAEQDTIKEKPPYRLSVSSWYSLDELQSYINESKRQADSLGIDLNGFRIYVGVFPDEEIYGKKRNQMAFFISPTGNRSVQQGAFLLQEKFPGDIPEIAP